MEESTDPERHNGGTSHATGKHQAGGASRSGGKHQAGGKHQVGKTAHAGPKHAAPAPEATSTGTSSRGPGKRPGTFAVSRRNLLVAGGALAAAVAGLEGLKKLAVTPNRIAAGPLNASLAKAHGQDLPDIQFDIGAFTAPAQTINGVLVALPPVFTLFATATLERRPSREDQRELDRAFDEIERAYPFSPQGVFAYAAYGLTHPHDAVQGFVDVVTYRPHREGLGTSLFLIAVGAVLRFAVTVNGDIRKGLLVSGVEQPRLGSDLCDAPREPEEIQSLGVAEDRDDQSLPLGEFDRDPEVHEAQRVGEKHRQHRAQRLEVRAVRHLELEHHDRDENRDDAVAERFETRFTHESLPR